VTLLLDTHAFLWWVGDPDRLSRKARAAISRPTTTCFVSLASCWEMAIKVGLGRLTIPGPLDRFVAEAMGANAFRPLAIQLPHVARVAVLPRHHGDPFDRLLASQALVDELAIVSRDDVFGAYGVERIW
jgi:PIN domain nuclease of toxin-antitoxin system